MPYIGNTIRAADDYRLIDDISSGFNGSETSFALQVAGSAPVPFPKSPQQVLISVNGVIQEPDPTGSSGFNLVGTNIVFSSAPTNGHAFFGIIYATADYLNAGGNFPSGSLGAPSLTFIGDENTGLYRKSGGSIGFVSDATEIANTDSNGITISSGNLILGDSAGASSDRVVLGASSDFSIYHDGTQSVIKNATGNLDIITGSTSIDLQGNDGSETLAKFQPNGAVELYFDNAKKAETVTGGFTVTGVCTATSFAGDGSSLSGINTDLVSDTSPQLGGDLDCNNKVVTLNDSTGAGNNRLKIGNAGDLQLFHLSDANYVSGEVDGKDLYVRSRRDLYLVCGNNASGYRNVIYADNNGTARLYHPASNAVRLNTSTAGVSVTGTLTTSDTLTIQKSGQASLIIGSTNAGGAFLGLDGDSNGDASGGDYSYFRHNTSGDLEIVGNKPSGGANLRFYANAANLYLTLSSSGNLYPQTNNAQDLGTTAYRFRNIYVNDLQLSNEAKKDEGGNDVDGTWGDFTIQEGKSDLFLINNRSGKKYKFNLTEVS